MLVRVGDSKESVFLLVLSAFFTLITLPTGLERGGVELRMSEMDIRAIERIDLGMFLGGCVVGGLGCPSPNDRLILGGVVLILRGVVSSSPPLVIGSGDKLGLALMIETYQVSVVRYDPGLQHKLQGLSYHDLSHQFDCRMSQFMSSCHGQIERDVLNLYLFGLNGFNLNHRTCTRRLHVRFNRRFNTLVLLSFFISIVRSPCITFSITLL